MSTQRVLLGKSSTHKYYLYLYFEPIPSGKSMCAYISDTGGNIVRVVSRAEFEDLLGLHYTGGNPCKPLKHEIEKKVDQLLDS